MKNVVVLMVLVVIMSISGLSQTKIICLESIQKEDGYSFCVSPKEIEKTFKSSTVERCRMIQNEEGYTKFCFFTVEESSFSELILISEIVKDPNTKVTCVYMEFFYGQKKLYLPEKDEKIWWQATNLLNNAEVSTE